MKLKCTTTFLDDRERFEVGETLATESGQGCRVITEDQAMRFEAAGWAKDPGTVSEGVASSAMSPVEIKPASTIHRTGG